MRDEDAAMEPNRREVVIKSIVNGVEVIEDFMPAMFDGEDWIDHRWMKHDITRVKLSTGLTLQLRGG